ncbi:xylan 1,4-beta-xylosidase [Nonomuraea sp. NPDC046570]|uniref:GH39 family glycosyl hydrolase n=1 Tax=Nonomuraea sp. NPDC046570 TaxID=3155255 RepID=UPI0033E894C9
MALVVGIMVYAGSRNTGDKGETAAVPTVPQPAPTLEQPPATEAWPRWGVTHTQFSADNQQREVTDGAAHVLSRVPLLQNQHIMGWGAGNPEPSPGKYDWRDLDRRVKFMSKSQAIPVITLCCAPDWMKGGTAGRTDWSKNPTVAPKREHFDDYAKLAATVAKRYKTVKHFMVWNEFKGFWNPGTNRWDAEAYTELYNKVYDALKKVDEDIQVGGPYVPIESSSRQTGSELSGSWGTVDQRALDAIEYWIDNKKGGDFIVVDGASMTTDKGNVPDDFGASAKFGAITTWLRQKSNDMPVWWAEWYVEPENSGWTEERRTAVQAAALMEFAKSGVTTALYWNPQRRELECPGCLWTTREGQELPMAGLLSGFTRWFPGGTGLEEVTVSDPKVKVLAQPRQMVMVNTTDGDLSVTVDGKQFTLSPHEIKWSQRGSA